jgi:endonuclease-3
MAGRQKPPDVPDLLEALERRHGRPAKLPPKTALDWIWWENAAYLVTDERRALAYAALKKRTGLAPARVGALSRLELLELARLGGMMPEGRVTKWLNIAAIVAENCEGDLDAALDTTPAKARRELKRFPGIGAPGADKILLFTEREAVPALDSNGLRVLVRLGLAAEGGSYAATYRSGVAALAPFAERGAPWLRRAFELLRVHGQALCKNAAPACDDCPLEPACPGAA